MLVTRLLIWRAWPPCLVLLLGSLLVGCGGEGDNGQSSQPQQVIAPSKSVQGKEITQTAPEPKPIEKSILPATEDKTLIQAPTNTDQIEQLQRVSYLSSLSQQQLLALLNELQKRSPSQRMALLLTYPTLAGLPIQQKEVLLEQLAQIVPVTTQPNLLKCGCKNGTKYEICIREDCGQRSVVLSLCDQACSTIGHTSAVCLPSEQCVGK